MGDKQKTEWFDPKEIDENADLHFSTEFSDEAEEFTYKRYKLAHYANKQKLEDYQLVIDAIQN